MRASISIALITLLSTPAVVGQVTANVCPVIVVAEPTRITPPGDAMFFRAEISGLDGRAVVTYVWKVSRGKITDGQGSDQIRIQTAREDQGTNITASVTVKGLSENCTISASGVAGVAALPSHGHGEAVHEYGHIPWFKERTYLDNLLVQMRYVPELTVFIHMKIRSDESFDNAKKHIRRILEHLRWREKRFDRGRIRFGIEKNPKWHVTSWYILPKGGEPPVCGEGCILLSGKDF